jgi:hypothetical protein
MTTKSRQSIYGASIRAAAERATEARKEADRLGLRRLEQAHARLAGRRAERGVPLSRSAVRRLRHAPDRGA